MNYYDTYDIEVILFAIMTIAKYYLHYGYYHHCHNSYNSNNSNNIFLSISTHKSGIWGWILGLTGGKHLYIQGPAIAAKILRKPDGVCTSFLADTLRNRRQAPSLTPCWSATRTLRSRIFGPKFISAMHCQKNRAELVQPMQIRR